MTQAYQKLVLLKKRTFLIILAFMVITHPVKSQNTLNYKYFVGTTNPDTNWKSITFNDSSWLQGFGSIGYGDNDDSTLIDTSTSVYIRYSLKFDDDYQTYKGIIIYPDFDDGFIAYLNSVEIFRVNIADSIENPNYLQTPNRSHEAFGYRSSDEYQLYDIPGYYIDSLQLAECAIDTINLLAFAVFNDSINGSDLTFSFHYTIVDTLFFKKNIFREYIAKPAVDSIELPYIVIETDEFGISENSVIGSMGIINNLSKQSNRITDNFTDYNGRIRLKLHGTYSLQFPKKSLRIELQDILGRNNNVSILGLPEENDFILYAPYQDKTLIKNVFTYTLGRRMGYYAPRTRFCELVLNGNDLGLYVLTEKIKQDKNRVNITELNNNDNVGISITGGYILEYNHGLEIIYPDPKYISLEQENYINRYIEKCQDLIQQIDYCKTENEYKNYIDINSVADYYIINELSLNFDAFSKSWFMYKDNDMIDGRLKYGPLWDYNVAWCYYLGQDVNGWRNTGSPILSFSYIKRDTTFAHLLISKWNNYRKGILSTEAIFGLIDSITAAIAPAIERNYQIWPVIQYNEYGGYVGLTYKDWLNEMKTWIEGRLLWMDENIGDFDYNPDCNITNSDLRLDNKENETLNCYPNPFVNKLNLKLFFLYPGDIKISIYNLAGIELYTENFSVTDGNNQIKMNIENKIAPGFYTLIITKSNELVNAQKIIKE